MKTCLQKGILVLFFVIVAVRLGGCNQKPCENYEPRLHELVSGTYCSCSDDEMTKKFAGPYLNNKPIILRMDLEAGEVSIHFR